MKTDRQINSIIQRRKKKDGIVLDFLYENKPNWYTSKEVNDAVGIWDAWEVLLRLLQEKKIKSFFILRRSQRIDHIFQDNYFSYGDNCDTCRFLIERLCGGNNGCGGENYAPIPQTSKNVNDSND